MTDLIIWRSICPNCRQEMFRGSIPPAGQFIYVQCPHCGDVWKVWSIPHSQPMLVRKWENCVTIETPEDVLMKAGTAVKAEQKKEEE